jgi:hypothetical protein
VQEIIVVLCRLCLYSQTNPTDRGPIKLLVPIAKNSVREKADTHTVILIKFKGGERIRLYNVP